MHVTIDNVFAFLVLLLILVTFMGYIIPSAYLSFTSVKEHQLEEVAQAVMDKILLSPGIPEDWGNILVVSSSDELSSFGLHNAGGEPYVLDMDKVLRMVNVGEGQLPKSIQIDAWTIVRLLGLENKYGLSIRIYPALNITQRVVGYYDLKGGIEVPSVVDVTVKTPEGRPAINANATGIYVFLIVNREKGEDVYYVSYFFKTGIVNLNGEMRLDFTTFLESAEVDIKSFQKSFSALIVYADYYGIRAANSSIIGETDILQGTTVGDYLILSVNGSIEIPAARHLYNQTAAANPPYYIYLSTFHNETKGESGMVINTGAKKYRVYELTSGIDEDVTLLMLPVKYRGKYYLASFLRPPYSIICQTGMAQGNIKTSVLKRMVRIGSFHYTCEVFVWRWGE